MSVGGRRRVLLLAQQIRDPDDEVAPHGSGAHAAATLAGLRRHFDVFPLFAPVGKERAGTAPALRRLVPGRLRGLRNDLRVIRGDREFGTRAFAAARDFRPDIVYARSEYLCLASVRVARKLGVPLVLEVNGLLAQDVRTIYRSPLEPLGVALERLKHRRAAAIVTVSPGLAERLGELGAETRKLAVVPNSVSPDRLRARRDESGANVVIGWIGHLMRWHLEALELLVDIAPEIVRAAPNVEFLVVGGGPGLDALTARAAGVGAPFRFLGPVAHELVPDVLGEIDIGVIPAVFDYAFPVKIVEFGAAEIPVVAPQSASLDAQIVPGVEYEPFVPGDRRALAEALIRLAVDPERRRQLGESLQEAVRARYTWDATADALLAVVERALGTGGISSTL